MSIWHTKQEKPARFRDIICKLLQHKYNGRIVYRNTKSDVDFYLTGVEKWAYPEDFNKAEEEIKLYRSALMAIEVQTAALGGTKKDMVKALLDIDNICRDVLER